MMPPEIEELAKLMNKSWDGGSIAVRAIQNENENCWHILVYPALREISGGKDDGGQIFSRFTLKLNKFVKCFDKLPEMIFDSAVGYLVPLVCISGYIKRKLYYITFLSVPPPDSDVSEVYHSNGPKKGTVEPRIPQEEEDE